MKRKEYFRRRKLVRYESDAANGGFFKFSHYHYLGLAVGDNDLGVAGHLPDNVEGGRAVMIERDHGRKCRRYSYHRHEYPVALYALVHCKLTGGLRAEKLRESWSLHYRGTPDDFVLGSTELEVRGEYAFVHSFIEAKGRKYYVDSVVRYSHASDKGAHYEYHYDADEDSPGVAAAALERKREKMLAADRSWRAAQRTERKVKHVKMDTAALVAAVGHLKVGAPKFLESLGFCGLGIREVERFFGDDFYDTPIRELLAEKNADQILGNYWHEVDTVLKTLYVTQKDKIPF